MTIFIENPTYEDRKSITNIVYLITNITNDRNYVGETKQTFLKRYCAKEWWTQLDNKELKRDIIELGINNFKVTLLEKDIYDVIERRQLEHKYALRYETYYPNGYNIALCGAEADFRDAINRGIEKLRQSMRKYPLKEIYEFINPLGNKITINDLPKFCKENNLDYQRMLKVDRGESKHCSGYSNPNNPIKFYELISPDNKIYKIRDDKVCEFSLEQGLRQGDISYLTREDCKIYHGWRLLKNKDINPDIPIYTIKSPEGKLYTVEKTSILSKEFDLDFSSLRQLVKGNIKQHKGWTLQSMSWRNRY